MAGRPRDDAVLNHEHRTAAEEGTGRKIASQVNHCIAVVRGTVQHGDRRGRELGFPTANVHGPDAVRLDGVYVGILQVGPDADGPSYVTAVSVGHRPTFYGREGQRLLEAHLLDFEGDLYGRHVRIDLHHRLRPQRKYVDEQTLVRQLRLDVEAARAWALVNGMDHLLRSSSSRSPRSPAVDGGRRTGSRPVIRRKKRAGALKSAERRARREQQIRQAMAECDTDADVSPEWLAQRVGLPLDHARWYLRSRDVRSTSA
jgi:Riboflavin kinase